MRPIPCPMPPYQRLLGSVRFAGGAVRSWLAKETLPGLPPPLPTALT
jgi:hypothetical protein